MPDFSFRLDADDNKAQYNEFVQWLSDTATWPAWDNSFELDAEIGHYTIWLNGVEILGSSVTDCLEKCYQAIATC
jgi:hypothetical protein